MRMRTRCRRFFRPLQQTWLRAMLYALAVPLFPEYIAPFLAILSFVAALRSARQERRPVVIGTVGKALFLYILYLAITLLFAEMRLQSAESLLLWVLMGLVYFSLVTVLTDRQRLDTALFAVSVVAGLVGFVGCVQYFLRFLGMDTPLQLWEPLDRLVYSLFPMNINIDVVGLRVSSTFSNPNIAGQYLVLVTPFTAHYALHGGEARRRRIAQICLVVIVGCAAFTFSRGTYLALLVVAVVFIIANIRSIVSVLLSFFAALLLVPDAVWSRLMSVGTLDPATLERLNVWNVCIGLIAKQPLFGYGCGVQYTWSVMLANGIPAPHAHNLILQVLVEGGVVGLILMLFLGLRVAQSAFLLTARKDDHHFGVALIAFIAGFCTNSMVEYGFTFPKLIGTFALVLAVTDVIGCLRLGREMSPVTHVGMTSLASHKAGNPVGR